VISGVNLPNDSGLGNREAVHHLVIEFVSSN